MKFLAWHLGLGDAIAFADLAVKLADGEQMLVPCYAKNEVSVKSIFVNHPNIGVCDPMDPVIVKFGIEHKDVINIGHYSGIKRKDGEDMIEWVYRTAGMLVEDREFDVVDKACESVGQAREFGEDIDRWLPVVHDEAKRGFEITRTRPKQWSEPFNAGSILAWSQALVMAPEIHVIDSAILHLTEQLQLTGKLYYHKYARPHSEAYRTLRHNWTVLD